MLSAEAKMLMEAFMSFFWLMLLSAHQKERSVARQGNSIAMLIVSLASSVL